MKLTLQVSGRENTFLEVNPLAIDQTLFKHERSDLKQEETRKLILEAFEEVKKNSKYAKPFKTMIPDKTWNSKTVKELKKLANSEGGHIADWIEQALEWAQRIFNGESWEDICNKTDTTNWYRLVVWKNGYARLVGGSIDDGCDTYVSDVGNHNFTDSSDLKHTVPLVVFYE